MVHMSNKIKTIRQDMTNWVFRGRRNSCCRFVFFRSLFFLLLMMTLDIGNVWADPTEITSLSSIGSTGDYIIKADIDASSFTSIASFSGTLEAAINSETHMPFRIKNLKAPLFTTLTGTVKNLVIESVTISGHFGNTGTIACTANGSARIYNVGILGGSSAPDHPDHRPVGDRFPTGW